MSKLQNEHKNIELSRPPLYLTPVRAKMSDTKKPAMESSVGKKKSKYQRNPIHTKICQPHRQVIMIRLMIAIRIRSTGNSSNRSQKFQTNC